MPAPRRAPFPYDVQIGGIGYMLGHPDPKSGGPLVAVKPPDNDVQPIEFGYSTMSPKVEKIHPFDDMSLGMGQSIQFQQHERKYHYAINADLSNAGFWILGPEILTTSIAGVDTTHGVTGFVELLGTLYVLNGQYIWKTTDGVTYSKIGNPGDAGGGFNFTTTPVLDAIGMQSNAGGVEAALYIAVGDANDVYRWRPASDAAADPTNAGSIPAHAFGRSGSFLYAAQGNSILNIDVDADPYVAANWGAALPVGTADQPITKLMSTSLQDLPTSTTGPVLGSIMIIKQDGIYSIANSGSVDNPMYPFLASAPSATNGVGSCYYINDVIVPFRDGLYRIHPDWSMDPIGPERLINNRSDVAGRIVSTMGHDTFGLYAIILNEISGNTYLLKFGAYLNLREPPDWIKPGDISATRVEAWHGSLSLVNGNGGNTPMTCLFKSAVGAPAGHAYMYIGYANGQVGRFVLPAMASPLNDSSYRFSPSPGQVFLPSWHAMYISDQKICRRFTVSNTNFSGSNYADVQYKMASSSVWNSLSQSFQAAPTTDVDLVNGVSGQLLDFQVRLTGTADTATPQMTGLGIHYVVRPQLVLIYEFSILADRFLAKRNGSLMRLTQDQIVANILAIAQSLQPVLVVLPDESTVNLAVIDYKESLAWDERVRRFSAAVTLQCAPFFTVGATSTAVSGSTTYNALAAYLTYQGLYNVVTGSSSGGNPYTPLPSYARLAAI